MGDKKNGPVKGAASETLHINPKSCDFAKKDTQKTKSSKTVFFREDQTSKSKMCSMYTGWWFFYPSEKYEFVNWDDEIPNIWENKIDGNQTTNQYIILYIRNSWCLSTETNQTSPQLHPTPSGVAGERRARDLDVLARSCTEAEEFLPLVAILGGVGDLTGWWKGKLGWLWKKRNGGFFWKWVDGDMKKYGEMGCFWRKNMMNPTKTWHWDWIEFLFREIIHIVNLWCLGIIMIFMSQNIPNLVNSWLNRKLIWNLMNGGSHQRQMGIAMGFFPFMMNVTFQVISSYTIICVQFYLRNCSISILGAY